MMVKTADKLEEDIRAIFSGDTPWVTIVWDDPVNLQNYVVYVFMELFGYSKARATELMLQVHNDGKAIVSTGSREEMEHDVARLHELNLPIARRKFFSISASRLSSFLPSALITAMTTHLLQWLALLRMIHRLKMKFSIDYCPMRMQML
jgi:ATP-dependent Clp protease adaptor protein ClpS